MDRGKVVHIRCGFHRGGFPSERVFIIGFESGVELRGVAPVQYCYTRDLKPLGDEPTAKGEVDGFVVGVIIGRVDSETFRVYLPDGDIYELGSDHVVPVHSGDTGHVPVKP